MYGVFMLTERLHVLVSRAQRHRLEAEGNVAACPSVRSIRDALDARLHSFPMEKRRRAIAEIKAMSGGRVIVYVAAPCFS